MENEQVIFTNISNIDGVYIDENNQVHVVCFDATGRNNVIVMHVALVNEMAAKTKAKVDEMLFNYMHGIEPTV